VNFIGNYYKAGPDTVTSQYEVSVDAAGRYGDLREQTSQMHPKETPPISQGKRSAGEEPAIAA
jgi:hypothetical protein